MSFSLKTLLASVTLVAVLLVASKTLHDRYYVRKLNRFIETGDSCSVSELLRYAHDKGFRANWADEVLENAATRGDCLTLDIFSHTADFDRKLRGERTALMFAAANGQFNAVKFLLVQNVNTRARDSSGATAFDIAMTAQHPEIAALISAAEHETWNHVLEVEELIFALLSDGACNRDTIEELLLTEKYKALADQRTNAPLVGEETVWFRVNDRISIGALASNVEFIWTIGDHRVEGVEYFYPPSYFK